MELSVVIPIYNRQQYLDRTLQSIARSTVLPHSLILVDNNSTDGSMDICRRFKEEHENDGFSVIIVEEKQPGANAARNAGLRCCDTEWIYFFDSDDDFDSDFISSVDKCELTDCDCLLFPTKMNISGCTRNRAFKYATDIPFQILSAMLSTQSMLFRTDYLRKIGGWNEQLLVWQDWELGTRLLLHDPNVEWIKGRTFHTINIHPDSITGNKMSDWYDRKLASIDAVSHMLTNPSHQMALILRTYILLGQFKHEKAVDAIDACKSFISHNFKAKHKIAGTLLSTYVAHGGRGAWKIAYQYCGCLFAS